MAKKIHSVKLVEADDEWIVQAFDSDGFRMPEADYFTDDKEDAVDTADAMVRGLPKNQG